MKYKSNEKQFIEKAQKIHGDRYDYSKALYKNAISKVTIICPKHGEFKQRPSMHTHKTNPNGCPICNSSQGESKIILFLKENNITFIPQKKFKDCKNIKELPFDFFLPKYNLCIEYDGEQHFRPIKYFGGEKGFKLIKKTDKIKDEYCKIQNIHLLRITYKEDVNNSLKSFFEESLLY